MEEWRDIEGFEDHYQVSNLGNVRNIKSRLSKSEKVYKPQLLKTGYMAVNLWQDGTYNFRRVHRLVAQAFIPNPEGKPFINHIDGDKTNNRADNLEWVTKEENERHARETGLHDEDMKRRRIPVIAINDVTGQIERFDSMLEASKALSIGQGNISKAIKRGHRAGGYRFKREGA